MFSTSEMHQQNERKKPTIKNLNIQKKMKMYFFFDIFKQ